MNRRPVSDIGWDEHETCSPTENRPAFFCAGKGGEGMKMVVVNAPKALAGLLKKLFGMK